MQLNFLLLTIDKKLGANFFFVVDEIDELDLQLKNVKGLSDSF